jgi:hypothetical protein
MAQQVAEREADAAGERERSLRSELARGELQAQARVVFKREVVG